MLDEQLEGLLVEVTSDASTRLRAIFPQLTSLALAGTVTATAPSQVRFFECLTNTEWEVTVVNGRYVAHDTGVDLIPPRLANNQTTLNRYRRLALSWLDTIVCGQWPSENPTAPMMLLALGVALVDRHMTALSSLISSNSVFALINQGNKSC